LLNRTICFVKMPHFWQTWENSPNIVAICIDLKPRFIVQPDLKFGGKEG
jgi:hypothetical protein